MGRPEREAASVLTELGPMDVDGAGDVNTVADLLPPSEGEVTGLLANMSSHLRRALLTQAELRTAWAASRRGLFTLPAPVGVETRLLVAAEAAGVLPASTSTSSAYGTAAAVAAGTAAASYALAGHASSASGSSAGSSYGGEWRTGAAAVRGGGGSMGYAQEEEGAGAVDDSTGDEDAAAAAAAGALVDGDEIFGAGGVVTLGEGRLNMELMLSLRNQAREVQRLHGLLRSQRMLLRQHGIGLGTDADQGAGAEDGGE
jgi:hypothetical protein